MSRIPWTDEMRETLRARYPHEPTKALAAKLGVSAHSVYYWAEKLGVRKSPDYTALQKIENGQRITTAGTKTRFHKNLVPWNKDRHFTAGGRSAATQFKPGQRPHTWRPIGAEHVTRDGYLERKIQDTGCTRRDYRPVHHLVWFAAGREIPPGHALTFRDGDKRNVTLDNLELITRKQLMVRNTVHKYGPEIAKLVQLRGAINRQINKRTRKEENHGE